MIDKLMEILNQVQVVAGSLAIMAAGISVASTQIAKAVLRMKWPNLPGGIIWALSIFITLDAYGLFVWWTGRNSHDPQVLGFGVGAAIAGPWLVKLLKEKAGIDIDVLTRVIPDKSDPGGESSPQSQAPSNTPPGAQQ